MDWLKTIQSTLTQIEDQISESGLTAEALAKDLFVSASHLQRAFSVLTNMTLSEYIRNRRMSLAANAIREGKSVMETALNFGYESPEAFSKAFKRFHGITPTEAKSQSIQLIAYPPLQIQLTLKGDEPMNYKLVDKPAFTLVGTSIEVSTEEGENFKVIPTFWMDLHQNGTIEKLRQLPNLKEITGACIMEDLKAKTFTYAAAGLFDTPVETFDFKTWEVESNTWAIFECIGPIPEAIQKLWKRIFAEWFPATGFEHANAPELEIYRPGDMQADDYKCEIWIPIIKRP